MTSGSTDVPDSAGSRFGYPSCERCTLPDVRASAMSDSRLLRRTGRIILGLGIVAAGIFYAFQKSPPDAMAPDLSTLRYERARERELGMMMGQSGLLLSDLQRALDRPYVEALLIAAGAGLFSLYFFRAASVQQEEEAEQRDAERRSSPD